MRPAWGFVIDILGDSCGGRHDFAVDRLSADSEMIEYLSNLFKTNKRVSGQRVGRFVPEELR
jgi:hypothetical protein